MLSFIGFPSNLKQAERTKNKEQRAEKIQNQRIKKSKNKKHNKKKKRQRRFVFTTYVCLPIYINITMVIGESRTELLHWLNTVLDLNYTKVEQCGTGAAFCQLMDSIVGNVPLNKVKFGAKSDYESRHNWKILQQEFTKHKINKHMDVEKLIKCRLQDNLELLQWFKRYWNEHKDLNVPYDAQASRRRILSSSSSSHSNSYSSPSLLATTSNTRTVGLSPHTSTRLASSGPGSIRQVSAPLAQQLQNMSNKGSARVLSNSKTYRSSPTTTNNSAHSSNSSYTTANDGVASSNYSSSNLSLSNKVRTRKSTTPVTSRVTTPVNQRPKRFSSATEYEKRVSLHNGGNGSSYQQETLGEAPHIRKQTELDTSGGTMHIYNNEESNQDSDEGNDKGVGVSIDGDEDGQILIAQQSKEIEVLVEENNELKLHLSEYRVSCDTLQTERNFYFNKLRDIELLIQNIQADPSIVEKLDVLTLTAQVEKLLYKTEEGFSDQTSNHDMVLDTESF